MNINNIIVPNDLLNLGNTILEIFLRNINQNYLHAILVEKLITMILRNSVTHENIDYSISYDEILDINLSEHLPEDFFDSVDRITITIGYSMLNLNIPNLWNLLGSNNINWEKRMLTTLKQINGLRPISIKHKEIIDIHDIYLNFSIASNKIVPP